MQTPRAGFKAKPVTVMYPGIGETRKTIPWHSGDSDKYKYTNVGPRLGPKAGSRVGPVTREYPRTTAIRNFVCGMHCTINVDKGLLGQDASIWVVNLHHPLKSTYIQLQKSVRLWFPFPVLCQVYAKLELCLVSVEACAHHLVVVPTTQRHL